MCGTWAAVLHSVSRRGGASTVVSANKPLGSWTCRGGVGRVGFAEARPARTMPQRERASILAELTPPFTLAEPHEQTAPFVFCSPHSGRTYPSALLERSRLDSHTLRKSEDCFVDE